MVSKTDFYELLGVSESSSPDEVKIAYRKQALIWHPDKNPDNLEEAHHKFKAINEAYTVLSDPHEKAWYDSHKSEILTGSKTADMDLWSYFSASVYPGGFTDDPDGFYSVYDEVFESLNKKENGEAKDKTKIVNRPRFGNSLSDPESLKVFYAFWSNFTTSRGFTWADAYNPCDAPNRKVRRLIEVENTKERNKHRKAYNEMVITLIDYIKKRDPRWIKYQEEARVEKMKKDEMDEIQRKEDEIRKKEYLEEHRKKQAERYAKEYKEKMMHRNESDSDEVKEKGEQDESDGELLWCEICKKSFINQGQLNNHNNSKKHKQNVQKVIKEVQLPEEVEVKKPMQKKNEKKQKKKDTWNDDSPRQEEEEKKVPNKNNKGKKNQEKKNNPQEKVENNKKAPEEEVKAKRPEPHEDKYRKQSSEIEDSDSDSHIYNFIKPKKQNVEIEDSEEEAEAEEDIRKKANKKQIPTEVEEEKNTQEEKKIGKAKLRREKKKTATTEFKCRVCGTDYQTKNKLFTHLKSSGHEKAH